MDPSEVIAAATFQPPAASTLDEWIRQSGALSPLLACTIVLHALGRASRMSDAELAATIESLTPAGIARGPQGDWRWLAVRGAVRPRAAADAEVVERLGAVLFQCLTGQPLSYPIPAEQELRHTVRRLRPDVPAAVADLTAATVSAPRSGRMTIATLDRQLRHALGLDRMPDGHQSVRTSRPGIAAIALFVCAGLWWSATEARRVRPGADGLTTNEAAQLDANIEVAQTLAMMDEHTASIQHYQQLGRMWVARVAPDDSRLAWTEAHEAWVRTLAGDRLTTEQLLENKPSWLAGQLGDRHPYTRAVRLALAETLEARGATTDGAALRAEADRAISALLTRGFPRPIALDPAPVPPGVLAHVVPNRPHAEGFRQRDGVFFSALTSTQRHHAARTGWQLHVIAEGSCRTTIAAGMDPRVVTVDVARATEGRWNIRVDGTIPTLAVTRPAATAAVGISIAADATGALHANLDGEPTALTVDPSGERTAAPYSLTFADGSPNGCAVVWLEIPFPRAASFQRSLAPPR